MKNPPRILVLAALAMGSSVAAATAQTIYLDNTATGWSGNVWNLTAVTDPGVTAFVADRPVVLSKGIAGTRTLGMAADRSVAGIQVVDTVGFEGGQISLGSVTNKLSFTAGAQMDIVAGKTLRVGTPFAGSNGFSKTGGGTLTLAVSTDAAFGGQIQVTSGTLNIAVGVSDALRTSGGVVVNGGTVVTVTSTTTNFTSNLDLQSGNLAVAGGVINTVSFQSGADFSMTGGNLQIGLNGLAIDQLIGAAGSTFSLSGGTLVLAGTINYANSYNLFTGFDSGSVSGLAITGFDTANFTAALSDSGVLSFSPIPEPSTTGLLILAAGSGLMFLRSRGRANLMS